MNFQPKEKNDSDERKTLSERNVWWIRGQHKGRELRQSRHTTDVKHAQHERDQIAEKLLTGSVPVKGITLAALVTDYVNDRATDKPGVAIAAKRNWRLHLHPFFVGVLSVTQSN